MAGVSGLGQLGATPHAWRLLRPAPGEGTLLLGPVYRGPKRFVITLALGKDWS